MRRRTSLSLLATSVAAGLALGVPPTAAVAAPPEDRGREVSGNGPDRNQVAATAAPTTRRGGAVRSASDLGYPRQRVLPVPAVNPTDASIKLGLVPYHDLAPRLNALQAESDRVSVEVIGQSTQGRDLHLVTVTAPETNGQARRQEQLRQRIEENPEAAAKDASLLRSYKAPVLVNGNIHGNEWEGTDGALQVVEELARSTDPAVAELLERTRLYVVLTVNPDGRVNNTRANAAGFDMNRDYITASQPEVVATRQVIIDKQPLVFLDMHGYVGGTLIEPGTPPHGQNYEYDLYIRHALANAKGMEAAIQQAVADGTTTSDALNADGSANIPFRDFPAGEWDDWPPIFTPMYSMFHGAVGHTIEFPLRVNNASYTSLSQAELQRRAEVNTAVTVATVKAGIAYADEHRAELLRDQIEVFRRGAAGEPRVEPPVGWVEGFDAADQGYTTTFPRAYVIPAVAGQRSPSAAARLVDHLVANDVRVTRADKAFSLAGRSYPAGSYVVDMHQPKRGLANVMLEAGRDISARVPTMYDISGWSHRLLWGASVDVVQDGDLKLVGKAVAAAGPTGAVDAPAGSDLRLALVDGKDVAALNALVADGVQVRWTADGSVVVPAAARTSAATVADRFGARFTAATGAAGPVLDRTVIAAAVAADELKALRDMGFEVRPVSTASLNAGTAALQGADVLFVSSGLTYNSLTPARRTELQAFLRTAGVVTRGATGAQFNAQAGLLTATAVAGTSSANGVVRVDNAGGAITAGALPHSFVYGPRWFTGLGAGVVAEQRYATGNPLVAGHWIGSATTGPSAAAGQASVVRGTDEGGASVVLFGTEPMFRDHPKGLYAQVARAVLHTDVTAGAAVTAP
jgi:hypothetical protein